MTPIQRILALPRVELEGAASVDKWMRRFGRPGGEWTFYPHQAAAFDDLSERQGGFYPWSVGAGKSMSAFFMGAAAGFDDDRVLILTTAAIKKEMAALRKQIGRHFYVPDVRVESYERISGKNGRQLLRDYAPSFLVLDEAHCLANGTAARTARVLAYLKEIFADAEEGEATRVVAMSGSFLKKSIKDYAHIAEWALGKGRSFCPSPSHFSVLESWARVLDDFNPSGPPGPMDYRAMSHLVLWHDPSANPKGYDRQAAREAFEARMRTCPGVVVYAESSCSARIEVELERTSVPSVDELRAGIEQTWELPNGVEVEDPLRLNAKLREASQGGYYYATHDGEAGMDQAAREWDYKRRIAGAAVNALAKTAPNGWDTPGLVKAALTRGDLRSSEWDAWLAVAGNVARDTEYEHVTDDVAELAVRKARTLASETNGPVLVWYWHRFMADALERAGAKVYRAGERPVEGAERVVGVSISAHGTGLNLQWAGAAVVCCPPSNGAIWEQFLGRIHRGGQARDLIKVVVLVHTPELSKALDNARKDADYYRVAFGAEPKLSKSEFL